MKKSKKVKIVIVLAAIAIVAAAGVIGYALGRSLPAEKKAADKSSPSKSTTESTEDSSADSEDKEPDKSTRTIVLYFADSNAQFVKPENREVALVDGVDLYRSAVNELIKGPLTSGNQRAVPETMAVQSVSFADGIVTVDFGTEFLSRYPRGSAGETMFVYSIVNTLTEFPEVKGVKFLAGGPIPPSRDYNYDLTQVFSRNESLISR